MKVLGWAVVLRRWVPEVLVWQSAGQVVLSMQALIILRQVDGFHCPCGLLVMSMLI